MRHRRLRISTTSTSRPQPCSRSISTRKSEIPPATKRDFHSSKPVAQPYAPKRTIVSSPLCSLLSGPLGALAAAVACVVSGAGECARAVALWHSAERSDAVLVVHSVPALCVMALFKETLLWRLRPGTRIVSYALLPYRLYLRVAFGAHRLGYAERSGEYLGSAQLPGSTIAMVDETAHRPLSSPSPFWLLAHHSLGRCDVHRCRWVLLLQLLLRIRRRRLPVITGMFAARRAASSSRVPRKPVCHGRSL